MQKEYEWFFVEDYLGRRYEYNSDTCIQPGFFTWSFGLIAGFIDKEDRTIVKITEHKLGEGKDEFEIVKYFINPISVGNMKDESFFRMRHLDVRIDSLPKLSPEAIKAIEEGAKEMRNQPLPDSEWDDK